MSDPVLYYGVDIQTTANVDLKIIIERSHVCQITAIESEYCCFLQFYFKVCVQRATMAASHVTTVSSARIIYIIYGVSRLLS